MPAFRIPTLLCKFVHLQLRVSSLFANDNTDTT